MHNKLLVVEKGKVVTIETNEEEEDLQALIIVEEEDEGMEDDIQPTHSRTNCEHMSLHEKGRPKCQRT